MDDHLRMSDAEREQAAAELGEHYAQGRLTAEEHAERLDAVWAARTRGELAPLFRDLPGRYGPAITPRTGASRRASYRPWGMASGRRGMPGPLFVVIAVLVVLTVVTHLPLVLAGVLVAVFFFGRRGGCARPRHWSRPGL
jgi:hypothetical protein